MTDHIDHEIKLSRNITLQPRQVMKSTGIGQATCPCPNV